MECRASRTRCLQRVHAWVKALPHTNEPCVLLTFRAAQDALEHITRLTRAAQQGIPAAELRPEVVVARRSPAERRSPGDRRQSSRGWLGSLAAAASVLSPQRLLPQLGGALPLPPPFVAAAAAASPALPRSRTLAGDGLADVAAVPHSLRCWQSQPALVAQVCCRRMQY